MHLTTLNRFQAAAIHFGISFAIFIGLVVMVFTYWYPGILNQVDQGWHQALMLIAGVDLVLGPLLTLLVFNPTKKSLKFDLSVIAICQLAALVAGLYTVHTTRPLALYVAFTPAGFETLYAHKVSPEVRAKLQQSEAKLFYYTPASNHSSLGPAQTTDLLPDELNPVTDAGFIDALRRTAPDAVFMQGDDIVLGVGASTDVTARLNQQGQLLGLEQDKK